MIKSPAVDLNILSATGLLVSLPPFSHLLDAKVLTSFDIHNIKIYFERKYYIGLIGRSGNINIQLDIGLVIGSCSLAI